jgi:hypothetical protein
MPKNASASTTRSPPSVRSSPISARRAALERRPSVRALLRQSGYALEHAHGEILRAIADHREQTGGRCIP